MIDREPNRIPIIRVWELLLVPLQGDIDDALADRLAVEVLDFIHTNPVSGLVLDVTGLWMMDSHLCAAITRLAQAAALMGARTIICGMSPETAMTLQTMGLDLGSIETVRSLEQALELQGIGRLFHESEDDGESIVGSLRGEIFEDQASEAESTHDA
jgi:rsbT antagonist protein RsbS